jgi:hypothetical protein
MKLRKRPIESRKKEGVNFQNPRIMKDWKRRHLACIEKFKKEKKRGAQPLRVWSTEGPESHLEARGGAVARQRAPL